MPVPSQEEGNSMRLQDKVADVFAHPLDVVRWLLH